MKHVVSVSLGSSKRNHAIETEFLGEQFKIERIGTDGDWDKALSLVRELDGKVDAFGMGGISLYVYAGTRKYVLKDAKQLLAEAKRTPMVDGGGLKNTLERDSIMRVAREGIVDFKNKRVLMVCGVDRLGMAQVLDKLSDNIVFGDLIYSLGIPIRITSLRHLEILANIIAPIIVNLRFDSLYPTGEKQEVIIPKFSKYYYEADIIAGDFLYIRRYLPDHLEGKVIITNTTTQDDVQLLKERGVKLLVTTTPEMEGRSFGTNVMEALLVTMINKPVEDITEEDYFSLIKELDFKPGIKYLND
ncbi:MAG: quinate 5-dehydrogenase [Syntrophomonadaceae bacterium]|mgnify:CR=1 FL=1|nr:quinate 5-dehydrogenase [Syntrophomonadaceae bacterium]